MKGLKFTRANLDELKPAEREYFAWSADLPGFGIRILPSGKRSWLVQFRNGEGVSCRRTIGDCRVVPITLAEARAQQLLANAKVYGVDLVQQEKAEARARLLAKNRTVGSIVAAYLSEDEVRARRSFSEIQRYLEVVWRDAHELDAATCTHVDLAPIYRRIASERGAVTANRAKATLSSMFTRMIKDCHLHRNDSPTAMLRSLEEKPRKRTLRVEELARVWQAAPMVNETFGAMIRLLILSGCRRSEISDLEHAELRTWKVNPPKGRKDLEPITRVIAELSGDRTKTDKEFLIPLAEPAMRIVNAIPRGPYARVFSGFRSWSHAKARLDGLIGITGWTLHDLRRSARTAWKEELGYDTDICELAMGHARKGVEGTYDRSERLYERVPAGGRVGRTDHRCRGRAGAGQGRERRADREGREMITIRVILALICLGALITTLAVEGEIASLNARLANCELASGLRSPWAGTVP